MKYIILIFCFLTCVTSALSQEWTWIYPKIFSSTERVYNEKKGTCLINSVDIPSFTQLIMSWNAQRPKKGYFSFWVQGRNTSTKKWGLWHKMMIWGKGVQKTFLSKSDAFSQHFHVRFESHVGKKCDGFRVKVCAHNGACIDKMYAITVTCADFTRFKREDIEGLSDLTTIKISAVPRKSQFALIHPENNRLCSPTSCAMLVEFLSGNRCNVHRFARNVFDHGLDTYGSWPFNTAHTFELCKGSAWCRAVRFNSFKDLHAQLCCGMPVVVSVRGVLKGAPKTYDSGHLLVVVGYDEKTKKVICHDPACKRDRSTVRVYELESFIRAWECSRRLAYHTIIRC